MTAPKSGPAKAGKAASAFKAKTPARKGGRESKAKGGDKSLTSERISEDLAAFRKKGGRVEVLGVTRVLTRVDEVAVAEVAAPPKAVKPPAPRKR